MKYRRPPTPPQWAMLSLMGGVFVLLAIWAAWELVGIFNAAPEDTYSEWFFDLPLGWLIPLAGLHLVTGILFVWSSLHFIEGWVRRRQHERNNTTE